jgi:purine-binding chemotaxis protein CheW
MPPSGASKKVVASRDEKEGAHVDANAPTDRVFLVFQVASSWFAVEPHWTQELAEPTSPTPVPRAPAYVAGLMPLRGRAVPLLDLRRFFGLEARADGALEADLAPRVVVVACAGMTVGLLADSVRRLITLPPAALQTPDSLPPGRVRDFAEAYVPDPQGLVAAGAGLIVVLDVPSLLEAARLRPAGAIA